MKTETIILIAAIVIIGLLIWQRAAPPGEKQGISPEVQARIDTLKDNNTQLAIDKILLMRDNEDYMNDILKLQEELANIKPNSQRKWNEYKVKTPAEKEKITYQNRDRMRSEMERDK